MAGVNRAPSVALLTSSVDLGEPGKLGPFIDERSVALAEQGNEDMGYERSFQRATERPSQLASNTRNQGIRRNEQVLTSAA